jgi:hypothetical protein
MKLVAKIYLLLLGFLFVILVPIDFLFGVVVVILSAFLMFTIVYALGILMD